MSAQHTPGPWTLCQHLKSIEDDQACKCGYRGVIFGPEDAGFAVCQPGHQPAPPGQEGSEPPRYPREVEIANARLITAAPDHADIGWAMCVGAARWEPWGDGRGDFCMNGLRFSTRLDPFGIPKVTDAIRAAIAKAHSTLRGDDR